MKILFFGTPDYAVNVLKKLYEKENIDILAIISQPNKLVGRKKELKKTPVAVFSESKNLNLLQPNKIIDIKEILIKMNPDLVVTAAYGQIIPESMLIEIADHNWFNLHASILPSYRGGAPIQKSILNNDKITGVTLMTMEKGMDTGDIIDTIETNISINDNLESLTKKLSIDASNLIINNIENLYKGKYKKVKQNEKKATYAYNVKKKDHLIDWNKTAIEIYNLSRFDAPKDFAYTYFEDKEIQLTKVSLTSIKSDNKPGFIQILDKKLYVNTKDYLLEILSLKLQGKNESNSLNFINGYKNKIEIIKYFK